MPWRQFSYAAFLICLNYQSRNSAQLAKLRYCSLMTFVLACSNLSASDLLRGAYGMFPAYEAIEMSDWLVQPDCFRPSSSNMPFDRERR
jgi:hypothetical protein